MATSPFSTANALASAASAGQRFLHMSPADTKVWEAALPWFQSRFVSFEYDVRLGGKTGSVRDDGVEEGMRQMWDRLVKKRVDVIAKRPGEVWIIEVKPLLTMAAVGQVITYDWLWKRERGDGRKTRRVIVCERIDEDLPGLLSDLSVYALSFSLLPARAGQVQAAIPSLPPDL